MFNIKVFYYPFIGISYSISIIKWYFPRSFAFTMSVGDYKYDSSISENTESDDNDDDKSRKAMKQ